MNVEGEKSDFFRAVQDDRKYIDDTSKLKIFLRKITFVLNWVCHTRSVL